MPLSISTANLEPNTSPKMRRHTRRPVTTPFNLMVVGHARTGKTSFLNTFYATMNVRKLHFDDERITEGNPLPDAQSTFNGPTLSAARFEFDDEDCHERILMRMVDTPGIDIPSSMYRPVEDREDTLLANQITEPFNKMVLDFLEDQFESTLMEESKVKRNPKASEHLIHACLYFLNPDVILAARGLTLVDRKIMTTLGSRVNIIPVIGKSDLVTIRQLKNVREWILRDVKIHRIPVYGFPYDDFPMDDDYVRPPSYNHIPFSIINSEYVELRHDPPKVGVEVDGQLILGREYLWGIVQVEHSDFMKLKEGLLSTHSDDLKTVTRQTFYEEWRTQRLLQVRESKLDGGAGGVRAMALASHGSRVSRSSRAARIAAQRAQSQTPPMQSESMTPPLKSYSSLSNRSTPNPSPTPPPEALMAQLAQAIE